MKTSPEGIKLISHFEGRYNKPYLCPASYVTGGVGHIIVDPTTNKKLKGKDGLARGLKLFPIIPEETIDKWLKDDLKEYEGIVTRNTAIVLQQHEFDALVSHTMNTGGSENLFTFVNKGLKSNLENWWTTRYITANGIKLNGLIRRRRVEFDYFNTGKLKL